MAWTAGNTLSTGHVVTAADWNNYMGTSGSIDYLGDTQEVWVECTCADATQFGNKGVYFVVDCTASSDSAWAQIRIPNNFATLLEAKMIVIPAATQAAADWDIYTENAAEGEAYNTHTDSDAATTYNVTNEQIYGVDFSGIMTTIAAEDICVARLTLNNSTHPFAALGFYMKYSVAT